MNTLKALLCAGLLMMPVPADAGAGALLKTTGQKTAVFLSHPQTLKWGFYVAVLSYAVCDALRDSDVHAGPDGRTYLTSRRESPFDAMNQGQATLGKIPEHVTITRRTGWHAVKQFDRLSLFTAGAFVAGAYSRGHITGWQAINRTLNGACLAYWPWRAVYTKNKFNQWHTTRAEYNQHLIPYFTPWNLQDKYIGASGGTVTAFYGATTGFGLVRMIFFDKAVTR